MSTDTSAPIAVIGTGYVGLVTAAGFAELGSEVWCVDVDVDKIDRLNRGEIPIYEPGLAESIDRSRARLHFGTGSSIKRIFAEHGKSGFAYVSCPEFLKEGSALADFLAPDRVVIGDDGN